MERIVKKKKLERDWERVLRSIGSQGRAPWKGDILTKMWFFPG